MDSEDGELFIKVSADYTVERIDTGLTCGFLQQLATFVRTHEKALANALQFKRQNVASHGSSQSVSSISSVALSAAQAVPDRPSTSASTSSSLAAALSLGSLSFTSHTVKSAKLALTPHHLFYLLSRFEELGIPVGPMKVRLENLHDSTTSANYVSFLGQSQRSKSRSSDVGSIRSVSSIRSVMSGMSALWASFGIGSSVSAARNERQKAALLADLKYLYSAFTKIPCLKLSPDWRARLIRGYEEFPFDSAVPLYVFKNVQALEVSDLDFRQFFGWDRLADQLRSLTIRRACLDDPADVLIDIVLDDMDKRRRRTSKSQNSPTTTFPGPSSPKRSPRMGHAELHSTTSAPGSPNPRKSVGELQVGSLSSEGGVDSDGPVDQDCRRPSIARVDSDEARSPIKTSRPRSSSPRRPTSSRNGSNVRSSHKVHRSGSGSSHSSLSDSWHNSRGSASNLLAMGILPASKWRFLKHLSLTDNSLTSIPANSLAPLANTLNSLDLSCNLFTQIPDSLATLTALRALNLSHCMIDSLHSLTRSPLPAITALNLRANRLQSIAGVERLYPLERLDLRDNRLTDPMELARLTGIPEIREIWVEGNPFTRSHRDYRVTIFNLFRKTPGYTEDIIIDDAGPSYSERKYLVERVAEPAAVPVVKPPVPEIPAVDVSKPAIVYGDPKEPAVLRKERPAARTASSEVNTGSTRRRRAAKRRIIDLATADISASHAQPINQALVENSTSQAVQEPQESNYRISQSLEGQATRGIGETPLPRNQSSPEVPRIDSSVVPQLPPIYASPEGQTGWKDPKEWDLSGELYRQKIETLRDRMGSGYLSVLSEEGWESTQPPSYHDPDFGSPSAHSPHHSNTSTPRAVGMQAIHSGRTLG